MKITLRLLSLVCLLVGMVLAYKSCSIFTYQVDKSLIYIQNQKSDSTTSPHNSTHNNSKAISRKNQSSSAYKSTHKTSPKHRVDINSADSLELLSIKGIGPYRASQIIKLRCDMLGFRSVEQLMMIYSIDSQAYNQIAPQIRLDSSLCNKLALKDLQPKSILCHPILKQKKGLAQRLATNPLPIDSLLLKNIILPKEYKFLSEYFE